MAEWGTLSTEAPNPSSGDLDTLSTVEVVSMLLAEDRRGLEAALRSREGIAKAASWVADSLADNGTVLFAGAGTSGRLGILEAAECPPTFGTDPEQIRAVIAGGRDAVFEAREGAEDVSADGATAVAELGVGDVLIAVSASSVTPFALGALESARAMGVRTVLVTCTSADEVAEVADLVLALDTGPEVLTGSTRLKAASATKAVLNAITTAAMVRLGKVFGNLMVDLRPGSAKLKDRALRIINTAGDVSRDEAERLYSAADGEVKTAIVMARTGLDAPRSRDRLHAAEGSIREALAGLSAAGKGGATQSRG
jgi:N-acetylmuramic acid 6-phosphate etherase